MQGFRKLVTDYGHDVTTAEGALAHLRAIQPRALRPYDRGSYIHAVRRALRCRYPDLLERIQGTYSQPDAILGLGWNQLPPHRYVDVLQAWLDYWETVAVRPTIVGSSRNPPIETVWAMWRGGWDARLVAESAEYVPCQWTRSGYLRYADQRARRLFAIRRVDRRLGGSGRGWISPKLAYRLALLSPQEQEVALDSLGDMFGRSARIRDVDWHRVRKMGELFRTNQRIRAAWTANGTERDALCGILADETPEGRGHRRRDENAEARQARERRVSDYLWPHYAVPLRYAESLARGVSPLEVLRRNTTNDPYVLEMTRASAARVLAEMAAAGCSDWSPMRWAMRHVCPDWPNYTENPYAIWRWFRAECTCPEDWETPGGHVAHRTDELRGFHARTLTQAKRELERRTAARVAQQRLDALALAARYKLVHPWPGEFPAPPAPIALLACPHDIVEEGKSMGHCIGDYARDWDSESGVWHVHIRTESGDSTATVDVSGKIHQHRGNGAGSGNATPPTENDLVLRDWCLRLASADPARPARGIE